MDGELLAGRFEADRARLRAVAYRLLGSASEADDAVQEAWLRLSRADISEVENLSGWLTTVVARVCLDLLRSRRSRREEPLAPDDVSIPDAADPEREALLAESVGLAMLAVLQRLAPAERVAFVLHDVFGVSFDEIADVVGRSSAATRQLASRGRRRLRGVEEEGRAADVARQREIVEAFFTASRGGDIQALAWRYSIRTWRCAATRRCCGWGRGTAGSRCRNSTGHRRWPSSSMARRTPRDWR